MVRPAAALRWLLPALLLLAAGLRLSLIARPGLHPDEALYASWALRIADGSDPALLGVPVDKPPFLLYTLAGLFRLAGVAEGVAPNYAQLEALGRLLGASAGVLSLALLAALARRVYGTTASLAAVALAAISPLAVRLSPSLLTDPWLVLWLLLAAWAALHRRGWLTGLAAGLAYATKQQAVLFLPWLAALFLLVDLRPAEQRDAASGGRRRDLWGLLWGFLLPVALVTWWDSLRWQWRPSFWERSAAAYGGVGLIPLSALPRQTAAWAELLGFLFGSPPFALALAITLPLTVRAAWRTRHMPVGRFDLLLLAMVLGYLALHLATTFAPWDRYALPLVPLLALLWARGLQHGIRWLLAASPQPPQASGPALRSGRHLTAAAAILLAGAALQATTLAVGYRLPVGDHRAYDGAAAVAAYLRRQHPDGAILYHHWLSWHYEFYLHATPVELRWWETPADLAAKAAAEQSSRPQFFAVPAGRDAAALQAALEAAGVSPRPVLTALHPDGTLSLTLYRLDRGSQPDQEQP